MNILTDKLLSRYEKTATNIEYTLMEFKGNWAITRITNTTNPVGMTVQYATIGKNPTMTTPMLAWAARATLNYVDASEA